MRTVSFKSLRKRLSEFGVVLQFSKNCEPVTRLRFYVYALERNVNEIGDPFYVGMGQKRRASHHFYAARLGKKHPKNSIIRKCWKLDIPMRVRLLWVGDDYDEAKLVEKKYISLWGRRVFGGRLTNLTDGGDGVVGRVCTEAQRQRYSLAARHRPPVSSEAKRNMRKAQRNRVRNGTHNFIGANFAWNKGAHWSEEVLSKMRGRKRSPESCEKMRQAALGRKDSAATRRKKSSSAVAGWEKRRARMAVSA